MNGTGQGAPILQSRLPFTPWDDPALSRMPGMTPVSGDWIVVDEAYASQMAEKARLLAQKRHAVLRTTPGSDAAQEELLEVVLATLPQAFHRTEAEVRCPDGRVVSLAGAPLEILGNLLQEDCALLQRAEREHVLMAALLCFPASWTLAEKIGHPLSHIHRPVPRYDGQLASRVQHLFDRIPAGRMAWRANALGYADADLYQPRTEADPKRADAPSRYLRCERQTLFRLPRTDAVVFAIHTYVVPPTALTSAQRRGCPVSFSP